MYPEGLLEWAGHRAGGVRRLFYDAYGRPSGELIETPLLGRLRDWAEEVAAGKPGIPRIVLLVGGPGNGKTEAVEAAIRALEQSLALDGTIVAHLAPKFDPTDGSMVPRVVKFDTKDLGASRSVVFSLVQDASVADPAQSGLSAAELLVRDLATASKASGEFYLACVNRGVLDDALISARATPTSEVHKLIEGIVRGVGAGLALPSCWPLQGFPDVAIWPMDVESLFHLSGRVSSPAGQALELAISADRWPEYGACPAGEKCPHCYSRNVLGSEPYRESLLQVLRYYEIASGKRWSFRDLFSLLSYLLAGSSEHAGKAADSPCQWASYLLDLDGRQVARPDSTKLLAPFLLVAAQYQHSLFSTWPRLRRQGLRPLLRELGLNDHPTLLGLHHFLTNAQAKSVPRTLQGELAAISAAIDPALASPDQRIEVSARTSVELRDIDARFSHSVREGYDSIKKYHCLSPNESELLRRLAEADDLIGSPEVRRRRPSSASKLQGVLRDFSCRVVRRTLGCRTGIVRDLALLRDFDALIGGDITLFLHAAKQVEGLLNEQDRFTVTLNNTFGEPPPPESRRVVLETQKQKVRPANPNSKGRPASDLRFLTVGSNTATQAVPLTYELFRSVRELQEGMLSSSLPRAVRAALDTARARLAGRIVRDEEALDGAEIRIGTRSEKVAREMGQFIIRGEEEA